LWSLNVEPLGNVPLDSRCIFFGSQFFLLNASAGSVLKALILKHGLADSTCLFGRAMALFYFFRESGPNFSKRVENRQRFAGLLTFSDSLFAFFPALWFSFFPYQPPRVPVVDSIIGLVVVNVDVLFFFLLLVVFSFNSFLVFFF